MKKIQFGLPECSAFIIAGDEMLVHACHERHRVPVRRGPDAGDHCSCAGQKKCTFQAGNSFLAEQSSVAGVARREYYQIRIEREIADFSNLQQTIFS